MKGYFFRSLIVVEGGVANVAVDAVYPTGVDAVDPTGNPAPLVPVDAAHVLSDTRRSAALDPAVHDSVRCGIAGELYSARRRMGPMSRHVVTRLRVPCSSNA